MSRTGPVDTRGSAATSAGTITSSTPGMASAAEASTPAMRAWASGLRTMRPWAMPGRDRSTVNLAWPVTRATPSTLGTERPMSWPSAVMAVVPGLLGRVQQGGHDADVAGAAADVADQGLAGLVGVHPGLVGDQVGHGHG